MQDCVVVTQYGKLQGTEGEVYCWKGIPYAEPPIGRLRFRSPQPPKAWEGIRDASEFGPIASQQPQALMRILGDSSNNALSSEDCLYLNVYSPSPDDKRRPVMVWIHGGAFMYGSGSAEWYDGTSFAQQGDLVLVTINYRLGPLGFLHLGEIGGEEYAASGNCGLLDQVAALKWVRENIEAFGGDPERVTIFGESAGAMSIGTLLALPSAKGLFHQAILQSGAASSVNTVDEATRAANKLLDLLGVTSDNLSMLEEIPVEQILKAANSLPPMTLKPVIDGTYLPHHPLYTLELGISKDIPIMIGTNLDEYRLFTHFDPTLKQMSGESLMKFCEHIIGSYWSGVSEYYVNQVTTGPTLSERLVASLSFMIFVLPALQLAIRQVKQGSLVWMYRFDWWTPAHGGGLGACHALEIPFVFNNLDKPTAAAFTGNSLERKKIADEMHRRWIAFAKNGDPNTLEDMQWPTYNTTEQATLIINTETQVVNDPWGEERLTWESTISSR